MTVNDPETTEAVETEVAGAADDDDATAALNVTAKLPTILRALAAVLDAGDGATPADAIPAEFLDALDPALLVATVSFAAFLAKQAGYTAETLREDAERAADDAFAAAIAGG